MKRRVFLQSTLGALGAVGAVNWLAGGGAASAEASRDARDSSGVIAPYWASGRCYRCV